MLDPSLIPLAQVSETLQRTLDYFWWTAVGRCLLLGIGAFAVFLTVQFRLWELLGSESRRDRRSRR